MKKIIAPIVYLLFFVPVLIFTPIALSTYEHVFGLRSFFGRTGDLEGLIIFLIISSAIFYLGNYIIQKIDHTKKPVISDHYRQASLYYGFFIYTGIYFLSWYRRNPISGCLTDCHGYAIRILTILIPLVAILINGFYLYRRRKANVI